MDSLTVQVDDSRCGEVQAAVNIVQQDDHGLALHGGQSLDQVGGVVNSVDLVLSAGLGDLSGVDDQSLEIAGIVGQSEGGANAQGLFLDQGGAEAHHCRVQTQHVQNGLDVLAVASNVDVDHAVIDDVVEAIAVGNLLNLLVVVLVSGQVALDADGSQSVGEGGGGNIGVHQQFEVVCDELNSSHVLEGIQVVAVSVTGADGCGQVAFVNLLGQSHGDVQVALAAVEVHVILNSVQSLGNLGHLSRDGGQVQDEVQIVTSQLHGGVQELTVAVLAQSDQSLVGELVVVQQSVDQGLNTDILAVIEDFVVQSDVGVVGQDDSFSESSQIAHLDVGGQSNVIALFTLGQNESVVLANLLVDGSNQAFQAVSVVVVILALDHQDAIDEHVVQVSSGEGMSHILLVCNNHGIADEVDVLVALLGVTGQGDGQAVDCDGLVSNIVDLNGVLSLVPGALNVHVLGDDLAAQSVNSGSIQSVVRSLVAQQGSCGSLNLSVNFFSGDQAAVLELDRDSLVAVGAGDGHDDVSIGGVQDVQVGGVQNQILGLIVLNAHSQVQSGDQLFVGQVDLGVGSLQSAGSLNQSVRQNNELLGVAGVAQAVAHVLHQVQLLLGLDQSIHVSAQLGDLRNDQLPVSIVVCQAFGLVVLQGVVEVQVAGLVVDQALQSVDNSNEVSLDFSRSGSVLNFVLQAVQHTLTHGLQVILIGVVEVTQNSILDASLVSQLCSHFQRLSNDVGTQVQGVDHVDGLFGPLSGGAGEQVLGTLSAVAVGNPGCTLDAGVIGLSSQDAALQRQQILCVSFSGLRVIDDLIARQTASGQNCSQGRSANVTLFDEGIQALAVISGQSRQGQTKVCTGHNHYQCHNHSQAAGQKRMVSTHLYFLQFTCTLIRALFANSPPQNVTAPF